MVIIVLTTTATVITYGNVIWYIPTHVCVSRTLLLPSVGNKEAQV
jgi:hypothetical protein